MAGGVARAVRATGLWLGLAVGALVFGAFVSGPLACGPNAPPRFERIVLVSIDTLRSDRLGAYGYPRATSPFLDGLAREGVVFERAYASMPTTAPSHATIFSSLHPRQHGLRTNGQRLPGDVATLAQQLRAAGFTTAGFVSTRAQWIPTGLDRGFEHFDARPADYPEIYRRADRTVDAAAEWLRGCTRCQRLLLFVHLFDPHRPLRPPDLHLDVFRGESDQVRARHAEFLTERQGIPLAFYRGDPGRMLFIADRYDAEIRFADAELARLHRALEALEEPVPALWVVTSDHGEGLGNHAFMGHGKVYEEGLRVPLLFWSSDGSLRPRRIPGIVQHVDLAPTLLALAGQPGLPEAQGRSLLGALQGEATPGRPAFAQRGRMAGGAGLRLLPQEVLGDVSGEQYAWIEERFKYLQHSGGAQELYDLRADPFESQNLLLQGDVPELGRMRAALEKQLEVGSEREVRAPALDPATREELRALGYAL